MSQIFEIHPENPQKRLIQSAASIVRGGGVVVYPTDSCYALGCHIGDKTALQKIQRIRGLDKKHNPPDSRHEVVGASSAGIAPDLHNAIPSQHL